MRGYVIKRNVVDKFELPSNYFENDEEECD